ncbi:MAG TPA: DUF4159 domain-containing protein, partial [Tepidisphaeraceae bacterium]|nr:DUF4159 domain-containing protein [Tepidisphaeraceae bacterium]
ESKAVSQPPPKTRFEPNPVLLSLRPTRPASPTTQGVTDERIGAAIQRGVDDLLIEFSKGQLKTVTNNDNTYQGLRALAVYALLNCSQAIRDDRINVTGPFMKDCLRILDGSLNNTNGEAMTYGRGIRATALSVYNRPEDHDTLKRDLLWLMSANVNGAYTYGVPVDRNFKQGWDNSNSQYGLLGVWSASEAGLEVPMTYWAQVEKHWNSTQLSNGQWGYGAYHNYGSLSMTVAGLASLFVTHDQLHVPKDGKTVVWPDYSPQLKKGLMWLEAGDNCVDLPAGHTGYTLYGIERVGLASGFKYFGNHDWYRELAAQSLDKQNADGSWSDQSDGFVTHDWGEVVETCYNLLFLSRGRHPVMMNKLRFDGAWNNRPRDLAGLTKFTSHTLERPINWQVVSLRADWADWMDSPILYIASDRAPNFSERDLQKLRNFARAGGMIFTNSDGPSAEFNAYIPKLVKQLFPRYELQALPADHPLYNVWRNPKDHHGLQGVSNGSRLLLVHAPGDLAKAWQLRDYLGNPSAFETGIDLFLTAGGKGDLRNRLQSSWILALKIAPQATIPIARLSYAGDYDPEPLAWMRFGRWLQTQTRIAVEERETPIEQLDYRATPLAVMTGRAAIDFTPAQIAAVRKFIEAGGNLLIDTCGGSAAFNDSATALLHAAIPEGKVLRLPRNHPMFSAGYGRDDLTIPRLRPYVSEKMGSTAGGFYGLEFGHGSATITDLDLTTGLLGTNTWGVLGYRPDYAAAVVKNWILYCANRTVEEYGKARASE